MSIWSRIERKEPNDCWLWQGAKNTDGYGIVSVVVAGKETTRRAHRLVYEMVNGPIADGMKICHTCDTPACCNPAHLWEGTHLENMEDMVAKGRGVGKNPGEAHGRSKLTEGQVRDARRRWRRGERTSDMAKEFGVSSSVLQKAIDRETWSHIL